MQTQQSHRVKRQNGPDSVTLNLLASALTILTAIALLGVASVFGDSSAPVAPERHERVIHDFYRAVNEAFRSGDSTALDRIVSPSLVFYPPSAGIAPGRAALERYLASVHDTSPAFQLRIEDIVSDGDRAVVRVAGNNENVGHFLGLALAAAPLAWGQIDSFRIVDRQIVEIRSGGPTPVLFQAATDMRVNLDAGPQAIAFERLSASPGERREWGPFIDPRVLYVDEGTITIDISPTNSPPARYTKGNGQMLSYPVAPGAQVFLAAGDMISFPPGARYLLRHRAMDAGVMAFTVTLLRFHYTGPYRAQEPTATDEGRPKQTDLAVVQMTPDGEQLRDELGDVTVAFGRVTLPPSANIAFHEADGYIFVVVDTGALVLTKEHGAMSLDRLNTNGRGLVKPGETFALHNMGDDAATVYIATVLPRTLLPPPAS